MVAHETIVMDGHTIALGIKTHQLFKILIVSGLFKDMHLCHTSVDDVVWYFPASSIRGLRGIYSPYESSITYRETYDYVHLTPIFSILKALGRSMSCKQIYRGTLPKSMF